MAGRSRSAASGVHLETWIKTSMAPLRGWGPKGDRVRGFVPRGHWRTLTFLGALRCDQLAAPCVFDGPTQAALMHSAPMSNTQLVLHSSNPADSASSWIDRSRFSHKSAALRTLMQGRRAQRLWYLRKPPYSSRETCNADRAGFRQDQTLDAFRSRSEPSKMPRRHSAAGAWSEPIDPTECNNYFKPTPDTTVVALSLRRLVSSGF